MDLSMITDAVGFLLGGGAGAALMQLYTAKLNKKQLAANVEDTLADVSRKKQDNLQDAFDTMYQQLSQCMRDYTSLSEEYREHREKMRVYEESVQEQIHDKCIKLAELRSKVTYLKGIRCYNTTCPNRVNVNPDRYTSADEPQSNE